MEQTLSLAAIGLFGFIGLFFYKRSHPLFQLIPFALCAGIAILLVGQVVPLIENNTQAHWSWIPGIFINVVFATLFLGKKLMSPRKIWSFAGPQIVFGQTIAWGQYVVGAILTMLVLVPLFHFSPLAAALIEISFEGGHGTAAGLGDLFVELDFAEGADLALGLATVGIVVGLLSGLFMTAIYRRKHPLPKRKKLRDLRAPLYEALRHYFVDTHSQYFARHRIARTFLQFALIGAAIGVGWLIKEGMLLAEVAILGPFTDLEFVRFIPLFPLAMIGGIVVQFILSIFRLEKLLHLKTIAFTGALALELVIVAAIATMSLTTISDNLVPFILLAVAGIVWNLLAFLYFAPRLFHQYWFERGIGNYGQSMGMTATGLLLMKTADPSNRSHALERFGYKQLLFEPIVGGGIFTALSMLIIFQLGLGALLAISGGVLLFWLLIGLIMFRK